MANRSLLGEPNVTIVVGKRRFNCHREVLAAKSAYFHSMFSLDMTEKRCGVVELKDVDCCAVKLLFQYASDGTCDISSRNVNNLLLAADMLLFETVREACVDFLQSHLNITNCLGIMLLVENIGISRLYIRAKQLALWEFAQVVQHSEFLQLSVEQLRYYLSSDDIRATTEMDIFNSLMLWVNHSPDDRIHHLVQLLGVVRFGLVQLKDVIRICKAVKSCQESYLVVKEIWFRKKSVKRSTSSRVSCGMDYASDASSASSGAMSKAGSSYDVTDTDTAPSWSSSLNCDDDSYNSESKRMKRCNVSLDEPDADVALNARLLSAKMTALQALANDRPRKIPTAPAIIGYIFDGDNQRLRAPELAVYDPVLKTVSKVAVIDKVEQAYHVAIGYKACVIENEVFVVGGEFCFGLSKWNPAVWKYNTFSETWKFVANLQIARRHHGLAVLNSNIYVIGGVGRFRIPLDSVEVLDVTTGTWSLAAKIPEPMYCPVCTVYKSKIYVFSADVYRYDPRSNAWTQMRQTSALSLHGALVLALEHAKCILLVAGTRLISYDPDAMDPDGSYFKVLGNFKHEVQNACVIGDLVYAFNQSGSLVVEVYDHNEHSFSVERFDHLKAPHSCHGCFALPKYT